jgi:hypothetical protein
VGDLENLKTGEAMTRVGSQRHRKKKYQTFFAFFHISLFPFYRMFLSFYYTRIFLSMSLSVSNAVLYSALPHFWPFQTSYTPQKRGNGQFTKLDTGIFHKELPSHKAGTLTQIYVNTSSPPIRPPTSPHEKQNTAFVPTLHLHYTEFIVQELLQSLNLHT